jgi:hypothetical protein
MGVGIRETSIRTISGLATNGAEELALLEKG